MDPLPLSVDKEQETSAAKFLSEDEGESLYPKRQMKSHPGKRLRNNVGQQEAPTDGR